MGVALAALSAMMYGSADFAGGYAARRSSTFSVVVVSQLFGVATALAAAPLLGAAVFGAGDLAWGAGAGLAGAAGLLSLYRGIASGVVSVVSPTAAVLGAVIPLLYGVATGQVPGAIAWVGIGLCLVSTAAMTMTANSEQDRGKLFRSLGYGAMSGAGFGLFFIFISRPDAGAGLWPLVAARTASIAAIAILAAAIGRNPFAIERGIGVVALAGVLDMTANVLFVLSTRFAMLGLATVITSLYPAPTVLLGILVFRERPGLARTAAFLCALAGVALISFGAPR